MQRQANERTRCLAVFLPAQLVDCDPNDTITPHKFIERLATHHNYTAYIHTYIHTHVTSDTPLNNSRLRGESQELLIGCVFVVQVETVTCMVSTISGMLAIWSGMACMSALSSMMRAPMAPPPICREVDPWWWGWYQNVPPAWSQGMVYSSKSRRRA